MRIITCFTPGALRPETRDALKQHALRKAELVFCKIDPTDPFAYGRRLALEWRMGKTFAIVEPDIVVREDVIDTFLTDPAGYLCFPYPWRTDVGPALGCTRFRASFIRKYPTAMDEAVHSGCSWMQFDVVLMRQILARKYGEQPKVCLPPVEHLNEAKVLLPEASREPLMSVPLW